MRTKKYIVIDDKPITMTVKKERIVKVGGQSYIPEIEKVSGEEYKIKIKNKVIRGEIVKRKQNMYTVMLNGNTYDFTIETENSFKRSKKLAKSIKDTNYNLKAPLPGTICEISVVNDQKIKKGDALLTLEAMKMQNEIVSPIDGVISMVHIKESDNVLKDQLLVEIEPDA